MESNPSWKKVLDLIIVSDFFHIKQEYQWIQGKIYSPGKIRMKTWILAKVSCSKLWDSKCLVYVIQYHSHLYEWKNVAKSER